MKKKVLVECLRVSRLSTAGKLMLDLLMLEITVPTTGVNYR